MKSLFLFFHPLLLHLASNIKAPFDASSNSQCLQLTRRCVRVMTVTIIVINV